MRLAQEVYYSVTDWVTLFLSALVLVSLWLLPGGVLVGVSNFG